MATQKSTDDDIEIVKGKQSSHQSRVTFGDPLAPIALSATPSESPLPSIVFPPVTIDDWEVVLKDRSRKLKAKNARGEQDRNVDMIFTPVFLEVLNRKPYFHDDAELPFVIGEPAVINQSEFVDYVKRLYDAHDPFGPPLLQSLAIRTPMASAEHQYVADIYLHGDEVSIMTVDSVSEPRTVANLFQRQPQEPRSPVKVVMDLAKGIQQTGFACNLMMLHQIKQRNKFKQDTVTSHQTQLFLASQTPGEMRTLRINDAIGFIPNESYKFAQDPKRFSGTPLIDSNPVTHKSDLRQEDLERYWKRVTRPMTQVRPKDLDTPVDINTAAQAFDTRITEDALALIQNLKATFGDDATMEIERILVKNCPMVQSTWDPSQWHANLTLQVQPQIDGGVIDLLVKRLSNEALPPTEGAAVAIEWNAVEPAIRETVFSVAAVRLFENAHGQINEVTQDPRPLIALALQQMRREQQLAWPLEPRFAEQLRSEFDDREAQFVQLAGASGEFGAHVKALREQLTTLNLPTWRLQHRDDNDMAPSRVNEFPAQSIQMRNLRSARVSQAIEKSQEFDASNALAQGREIWLLVKLLERARDAVKGTQNILFNAELAVFKSQTGRDIEAWHREFVETVTRFRAPILELEAQPETVGTNSKSVQKRWHAEDKVLSAESPQLLNNQVERLQELTQEPETRGIPLTTWIEKREALESLVAAVQAQKEIQAELTERWEGENQPGDSHQTEEQRSARSQLSVRMNVSEYHLMQMVVDERYADLVEHLTQVDSLLKQIQPKESVLSTSEQTVTQKSIQHLSSLATRKPVTEKYKWTLFGRKKIHPDKTPSAPAAEGAPLSESSTPVTVQKKWTLFGRKQIYVRKTPASGVVSASDTAKAGDSGQEKAPQLSALSDTKTSIPEAAVMSGGAERADSLEIKVLDFVPLLDPPSRQVEAPIPDIIAQLDDFPGDMRAQIVNHPYIARRTQKGAAINESTPVISIDGNTQPPIQFAGCMRVYCDPTLTVIYKKSENTFYVMRAQDAANLIFKKVKDKQTKREVETDEVAKGRVGLQSLAKERALKARA